MENSKSAPLTRPAPGALWRLPRVEQETGLRKSTLYQLMKEGKFVASVPLSARCVAWPAQAVEAWIEQRINATKGVT
jgi:prophage regulatory protein